jgi:hypothetical protein
MPNCQPPASASPVSGSVNAASTARRVPLAERDLALSEQVLQEFYVQATRPSRPDAIGHRQAVLLIESFRRFRVQDITSAIMAWPGEPGTSSKNRSPRQPCSRNCERHCSHERTTDL